MHSLCMHSLSSLKWLGISYCKCILSLPEKGLRPSLEELKITYYSEELTSSCRMLATSMLMVKIDGDYVNWLLGSLWRTSVYQRSSQQCFTVWPAKVCFYSSIADRDFFAGYTSLQRLQSSLYDKVSNVFAGFQAAVRHSLATVGRLPEYRLVTSCSRKWWGCRPELN